MAPPALYTVLPQNFDVRLLPFEYQMSPIYHGCTMGGGAGVHEATDTGLAYAPVSQAHGHHHTQFNVLPCSTAAQTSSVPTGGGGGGGGFSEIGYPGVVLLFKGTKGCNDSQSVAAAMQRPAQACE